MEEYELYLPLLPYRYIYAIRVVLVFHQLSEIRSQFDILSHGNINNIHIINNNNNNEDVSKAASGLAPFTSELIKFATIFIISFRGRSRNPFYLSKSCCSIFRSRYSQVTTCELGLPPNVIRKKLVVTVYLLERKTCTLHGENFTESWRLFVTKMLLDLSLESQQLLMKASSSIPARSRVVFSETFDRGRRRKAHRTFGIKELRN